MKSSTDLRRPLSRVADSEVDPSPAPRIGLGLLAIAIYCGAYLLWTLFGPVGAGTKEIVADWIGPVTALAGAVWSLLGPWRRTAGKGNGASNLISVGIAAFAVAEIVWACYEPVRREPTFPSSADAGYVASSLCLMAGILLLPSRPLPAAVRVRVALDSLMVMAALATFSWFFALGPTVLRAGGTPLAKTLVATYPILDLAMLFCLLVLLSHTHEAHLRPVRNLILVGVLTYIVSDLAFGNMTLHRTYIAGVAVDIGWMLATLLLAQAAFVLRRCGTNVPAAVDKTSEVGPLNTARPATLWRMLLPYGLVPVVAALAVYVYRAKVGGPLAQGVYLGSAALLVLVLIRQVFAIAENTKLYRYLQDAYRELESMATIDVMTGLPNHRVFQERLRSEIALTESSRLPVTLLLVDVDRFKSYNDMFGHPAGDEALRIVARLLQASVRQTDLTARYGGEEFAVILPATDGASAVIVAERIRAACEAETFPLRAVTLSIGIASCVGGEAGPLIEGADRALYAAKHGGRNRVAVESAAPRPPLKIDVLPDGWSMHPERPYVEDPSESILTAMLAMLSLRDQEVERHSDRVTRYCLRLAQEAVRRGTISLSDAEMQNLRVGSLLHDIGKIAVPDAILHKPDVLDVSEWQIVRRHPVDGARLLADVPGFAGAVPIVRSHHERWDGSGYPDHLVGEAIPLGARLFALADTLDAMWSDRPYRAALDYASIRAEVRRMSGIQFDPALVEAFLGVPEHEWDPLRQSVESFELARAA